MATSGDFFLATCGDFLMAMDKRTRGRITVGMTHGPGDSGLGGG